LVAVSRWREIDQAMIDQFADLINDHQFIHVDPERARQTPFGSTVAHGFLSLSMFGGLAAEVAPRLEGRRMSVNYGFDRLRFVAPVRAGRKVRAVLTLAKVDRRDEKTVEILYDATLEVDDESKPAIAAQWLVRSYFGDATR
jgi:acyl dehydratase